MTTTMTSRSRGTRRFHARRAIVKCAANASNEYLSGVYKQTEAFSNQVTMTTERRSSQMADNAPKFNLRTFSDSEMEDLWLKHRKMT